MSFIRRLFSKPSTRQEKESLPKATSNDVPGELPAQGENESDDAAGGEIKTKPVIPPVMVPNIADGVTRPLPPETVISSHNEHITFGQSTDVGLERRNNQDSALSFFFTSRSCEEQPDLGVFMVADGMGGHSDGEKASAMAVRIVASHITNNFYLPMLVPDGSENRPPISEVLIAAVQKANAEVIAKVPEGGTTLSAVVTVGDLAYIVHVGDSRIYMITKDGIEQITRDHSLVQRLVELDQITPEETIDHPQKNVLYRAIGQSETLEVDTLTRRLTPNSRILLCSDGLWGLVKENEIFDIVMSHSSPQEACDKLVALANTRGGIDNITAILLKIPGS